MVRCPQHTVQVPMARPSGWRFTLAHPAPANMWLRISVEDGRIMKRIDRLHECHDAVRFLSREPPIGPPLDELRAGRKRSRRRARLPLTPIRAP